MAATESTVHSSAPAMRVLERALKDVNPRIIIGTAVGAGAVAAALYHLVFKDRGYQFPGPQSDQIIQWASRARKSDLSRYLNDLFSKHSDHDETISVPLLGRETVVTTDIELAQFMFSSEGITYFHRQKRFKNAFKGLLQNEALFLSDGPIWKRHRAILTKAFTAKHIRYGNEVAMRKLSGILDSWADKQVVKFAELTPKIALDVVCTVLLSYDPKEADGADSPFIHHAAALKPAISARINFPPNWWWLLCPEFTVQRMEEAVKVLHGVIGKVLQEKQEARRHDIGRDSKDMLDIILEENAKGESSSLSEVEIIDEVLGFMLAGFDTTSNAMNLMVHVLLRKPDVQEKLYQEILQYVGPDGKPVLDTIAKMPYLDGFVKEVFRHHPVVWLMGREVVRDYECKGKVLRKGTTMLVLTERIHMDPRYFVDPEAFKPERWTDSSAWLVPGTYFPFLVGPHSCIAERLAIAELKTLVVTLLQRYRVLRCVNGDPDPCYTFFKTMRDTDFHVEFERR